MAGFLLNPRGLKPVSRTGSSLISPTTTISYIDPVNTLSLGNNEVVQLSPVVSAPYTPTTMPGYINARGADSPTGATLTTTTTLKAWGVLAGVQYKINQYPGEIRSIFWKQGTNIMPGTKVTAFIVNDPAIYFEVQTNSTTGLQQIDIGKYCNLGNINWIDGSANGADGISQGQSFAFLDLTTTNASPTASGGGLFDVEIMGLSPRPNNFFGTGSVAQPYNYAIVKFNSYRDK
jgi:hypothetical protein